MHILDCMYIRSSTRCTVYPMSAISRSTEHIVLNLGSNGPRLILFNVDSKHAVDLSKVLNLRAGSRFFLQKWSSDLCQKDSDGDGMTNGEELGDPNCTWTGGNTTLRLTKITHPGTICTQDVKELTNGFLSYIIRTSFNVYETLICLTC